jgi:asparagine synthase (glutamine-hydrolysing)
VAEFLRISVQFVPMQEAQLFEHWDDPGLSWP